MRAAYILRDAKQLLVDLVNRVNVRVAPCANTGLRRGAGNYGVGDVNNVREHDLVDERADFALVQQVLLNVSARIASRLVLLLVYPDFERLRLAIVIVIRRAECNHNRIATQSAGGFFRHERILVVEFLELAVCAGDRRGGGQTFSELDHVGKVVEQTLRVRSQLIIQCCRT